MEKYDKIGLDYNQTRKADPYLLSRMMYHLQPGKGQKFADIGSGTGNYTIALNERGLDFTGIEPSARMLETARQKSDRIEWKKGKAEAIPVVNNAVDGVLASLTIHHWENLNKGFQEIYRILKPSGRLVIFTSTPEQMKGYWLNYYFPKMLQDSILQMPSARLVMKALKAAGFQKTETEKYFIREDLQDLFLYAGKHHPPLYLNPNVRNGISSFSDLANAKEVEKGLVELQKDLLDQTIHQHLKAYHNELGDYLFVLTKKAN